MQETVDNGTWFKKHTQPFANQMELVLHDEMGPAQNQAQRQSVSLDQ